MALAKFTRHPFLAFGFALGTAAPPSSRAVPPQFTAAMPDAIHPAERRAAAPSCDIAAQANPPSLLWPVTRGTDTRYAVRLSRDPAFPPADTIVAPTLRWAIFNPHRELEPGTWHWQFAVLRDRGAPIEWSGAQTFRIRPETRKSITPPADAMLAAIPRERPRILTSPTAIDAYRARHANTDSGRSVIRAAKRLVGKPLPDIGAAGPGAKGKNAFQERNFAKWASKALGNDTADGVDAAVKAYLLTGDVAFANEAARRAVLIASWDPDGFTSPSVSDFADGACMRAMARAYDTCQAQLSPEQRTAIRRAIEFRARRFFGKFINNLEAKVFNAHVWQHILREAFEAAVSLHGDCPDAADWIAYTYELWIARAPALGHIDGSWGEGISYFSVNFRTLLDMPEIFARLTSVDFLDHPWYRNAPHYLLYCWPPGSSSDGFGDGAERSATPGPGYGTFTAALGARFRDPHALWYASQVLGNRYPESICPDDARLPAPTPPSDLPGARAFRDTGIVSMHSALGDAPKDLMIGFRSSPFGAQTHTHRNQNSFSLLYGGKRLFQGSGYYIAYGDEHFEGWYTSTKAHNTVLVDGKGQQLGPQGYGWIARFLHGRTISYCLGDASRAYGDAGLTRFRRHLALVRPGLVVIYDDLAADHDAIWSWRLHSPEALHAEAGHLLGGHDLARARVDLFASAPLAETIDTRFDPPADNWREKTTRGEAIEYRDQWHFDATTKPRARAARFLALIQVHPPAPDATWDEPLADPSGARGSFRVGRWRIRATMEPDLPATLSIESEDGAVALAADGPLARDPAHHGFRPGTSALRETEGNLFSECADEPPAAPTDN